MSAIHDESFPEFEALGEPEVRRRLACGGLHIMKQEPARAWLSLKEAEASDRRDAREERTLRIASRANTIAISAIMLSIATAIIVAVIQFMGGKLP